MADSKGRKRLAWLEGIRIFAAISLLFYHAQLLFTKYAFTPQPTGLSANLQQLFTATSQLGDSWIIRIFSLPVWFAYQFVDVFVLVSGFSLVLSLKGKPIEIGRFLKRRILRILLPFWTVAWLSYPTLWVFGKWTNSYVPNAWHTFAGLSFPILFDYDGEVLLPTSGPWWFVPLILSFTLVFPVFWALINRWGSRNVLIVSTLITFIYRAFGVYVFGGHPTYAIVNAPVGWQPFVPFIAKLGTFVLGMVVARQYSKGKGILFWKSSKALLVGLVSYAIGFVCQFYRFGWIFDDFLLGAGLTLCCMVVFRFLSDRLKLGFVMAWLGACSYSYFLIHNFVIDRTITLYVRDQLSLYYQVLPLMAIGTLILAIVADQVTPWIERSAIVLWHYTDARLTPEKKIGSWIPTVGESALYCGKSGWTIVKVQQVIHDKAFYLCRISNGQKTVWVNQNDLEQDQTVSQAKV